MGCSARSYQGTGGLVKGLARENEVDNGTVFFSLSYFSVLGPVRLLRLISLLNLHKSWNVVNNYLAGS